jgi:hypothetical protein
VSVGREFGDQVVVEKGLLGGEALVLGEPGVALTEGLSVQVASGSAKGR